MVIPLRRMRARNLEYPIPVRVRNLYCHHFSSLELKPITVVIGPPACGKSTLGRALYLFSKASVLLEKGISTHKLRELASMLLPGVVPGMCIEAGESRLEYTKDYRFVGEPTWGHSILLPQGFTARVKAIYEFSKMVYSTSSDTSRLAGLLYLLLGLSRNWQSFLGLLSIMVADLLEQSGEDPIRLWSRNLVCLTANPRMWKLLDRLIEVPEKYDSLLSMPDSLLGVHVVRALLRNSLPSTLIVIEEPSAYILEESLGDDRIVKRLSRGEVTVFMTISAAKPSSSVEYVEGLAKSIADLGKWIEASVPLEGSIHDSLVIPLYYYAASIVYDASSVRIV